MSMLYSEISSFIYVSVLDSLLSLTIGIGADCYAERVIPTALQFAESEGAAGCQKWSETVRFGKRLDSKSPDLGKGNVSGVLTVDFPEEFLDSEFYQLVVGEHEKSREGML